MKSQVESISLGGQTLKQSVAAPGPADTSSPSDAGGLSPVAAAALPKLLVVALCLTLGLLVSAAGVAMIVAGFFASQIGSGP